MTLFEILAYWLETKEILGQGASAVVIGVLSAAKFILVVLFYMHLKFDSRVFSMVFLFPATLATLAIAALYILYHVLPVTPGVPGVWN